jgi:uncharacterized protein YdeI (YjbR/CyaY-like superfamily)
VKPKFFRSQSDFRSWLEENHDSVRELWVGFYKKASGKGGLTYRQAVDEALCFGWIDGLTKRIDDLSYRQRFTPRRPTSNWSSINIKRVAELKKQGLMHPAGLAAFRRRDRERERLYSYESEQPKLAPRYEKQFRARKKAWDFFSKQPPFYRRGATWWVMSAKKEETRERRLATLIEDSANERRIAQFITPSKK